MFEVLDHFNVLSIDKIEWHTKKSDKTKKKSKRIQLQEEIGKIRIN